MIHKISFKNFFSFKEEENLNLTVGKQAPQTDKYFTDETGTKLNKTLAIFGPNGAGKTNALKVLSFLEWFLVNSFALDPEQDILVIPFAFTNDFTPSEISVTFSVDKVFYSYYVKLTPKRVLQEKLKKKTKQDKRYKTAFERIWNEKTQDYTWKNNFSLDKNFKFRLRQNASVLSTAVRDNHTESSHINNFWKKLSINVSAIGKINNEETISGSAHFFYNNPKLKQQADSILKKFDLGLDKINIEEKQKDNETFYNLSGVHQNEYKLSFNLESAGTKKLFGVLEHILQVLNFGGVAVLDEFDTDLHPHMTEEILNMFFSKISNPHNAQLIFSAHNPYLFNFLDKYQIALTEKNKTGGTEIWRLDEMKGVRTDDNYYTKYILGAYGGVPNIDN